MSFQIFFLYLWYFFIPNKRRYDLIYVLKKDSGIKNGIAWNRNKNLGMIVISTELIPPASDNGRVDHLSMSCLALLNTVLKLLSKRSLY